MVRVFLDILTRQERELVTPSDSRAGAFSVNSGALSISASLTFHNTLETLYEDIKNRIGEKRTQIKTRLEEADRIGRKYQEELELGFLA